MRKKAKDRLAFGYMYEGAGEDHYNPREAITTHQNGKVISVCHLKIGLQRIICRWGIFGIPVLVRFAV
jgi:hypothetical protein